jgi:hypothetical protein
VFDCHARAARVLGFAGVLGLVEVPLCTISNENSRFPVYLAILMNEDFLPSSMSDTHDTAHLDMGGAVNCQVTNSGELHSYPFVCGHDQPQAHKTVMLSRNMAVA